MSMGKNLLTSESKSYLDNLCDLISSYENCLVAYSGGVDSTFLSFFANKMLGEKSLMITAKSPSLDNDELYRVVINKYRIMAHIVADKLHTSSGK